MKKHIELSDPKSCLNKAGEDETLFVLRSKDPAAPVVIRAWVEERIALGLNCRDDEKIISALAEANQMDQERSLMI